MINLFTFLLLHLFGSSQGLLVQANNGLAICPADEVVFWCSSSTNFIKWQIRSEILSRPISFFFEPHDSSPMRTTLSSSPVEARLTHANDSFMNGTLTIMMATNLSRTTIICNNDALNVSSSSTDIKLSSAIFRLQSVADNISNFALNFIFNSNLLIGETYVINISPSPPFGPTTITTANSAALLPLLKNIEYNITVYFQACPARFISTLTFDINKVVTSVLITPSTVHTEETSAQRSLNFVIIYVIAGVLGCGFITLLISTIIGFLSRRIYTRNKPVDISENKSSYLSKEDEVKATSRDSLHEEMKMHSEPTVIILSQNIAYVQVKRM